MKATQDLLGARGLSLRRVENLLLIAWGNAGWPDMKEVQGQLASFRGAYPAGTGILNVIGTGNQEAFRQVWERLATLMLAAARNIQSAGPTHLGTAHLFESVGLRAAAARVLFRGMQRYGRDFARQGNTVVRTIDEATNWLHQRLSTGPVDWTHTELTDVIARFVRSHAAPRAGAAPANPGPAVPHG